MSRDRGFIVVQRRKADGPLWALPPNYIGLWLKLTVSANWVDRDWVVEGKRVRIRRGEVITSLGKLVDSTGLSRGAVRRGLSALVDIGEIELLPARRWTHIRLLNYCEEQDVNESSRHDSGTDYGPDSGPDHGPDTTSTQEPARLSPTNGAETAGESRGISLAAAQLRAGVSVDGHGGNPSASTGDRHDSSTDYGPDHGPDHGPDRRHDVDTKSTQQRTPTKPSNQVTKKPERSIRDELDAADPSQDVRAPAAPPAGADASPRAGSSSSPARGDVVAQVTENVIGYLNQTGKRRLSPEPYRDLVRGALDAGYTQRDLCLVVWWAVCKWGADARMKDRINPTTLFELRKERGRSFAMYLDEARERYAKQTGQAYGAGEGSCP